MDDEIIVIKNVRVVYIKLNTISTTMNKHISKSKIKTLNQNFHQ